jgi:hypothetical protein
MGEARQTGVLRGMIAQGLQVGRLKLAFDDAQHRRLTGRLHPNGEKSIRQYSAKSCPCPAR